MPFNLSIPAQVAVNAGGPSSTELVWGILLFLILGIMMALGALIAGRFLRPKLSHPEKGAPYECGEPAIGDSWVQFDLRFYVVALVFIIFDVEIALFWPWAVVFGAADASTAAGYAIKTVAVLDMLFFFGVVVVGFLFLWRFGYLDWVRASTGQRRTSRLGETARLSSGSSNGAGQPLPSGSRPGRSQGREPDGSKRDDEKVMATV